MQMVKRQEKRKRDEERRIREREEKQRQEEVAQKEKEAERKERREHEMAMNRMLMMLVMNNAPQGKPTSDFATMQQNKGDAEHEMQYTDDFDGNRSEKRSQK